MVKSPLACIEQLTQLSLHSNIQNGWSNISTSTDANNTDSIEKTDPSKYL